MGHTRTSSNIRLLRDLQRKCDQNLRLQMEVDDLKYQVPPPRPPLLAPQADAGPLRAKLQMEAQSRAAEASRERAATST
jgi:hypothetical protein